MGGLDGVCKVKVDKWSALYEAFCGAFCGKLYPNYLCNFIEWNEIIMDWT